LVVDANGAEAEMVIATGLVAAMAQSSMCRTIKSPLKNKEVR